MDVGMMMVFASYGWENCSDGRVWDEEIRLAASPPIWASTASGPPNTTSPTTRSCRTTSSL